MLPNLIALHIEIGKVKSLKTYLLLVQWISGSSMSYLDGREVLQIAVSMKMHDQMILRFLPVSTILQMQATDLVMLSWFPIVV